MNTEGELDALTERLNAYAPYVGAGISITHMGTHEIGVEMSLTERNVNLVGTHFGGSLYAMMDPHLMILLMRRLGPEYVVWDKGASIDFVRPGRGTVSSAIRVTDEEVEAIRAATRDGGKHLPQWTLEIRGEDGELVATVVKTLYVRKKREIDA